MRFLILSTACGAIVLSGLPLLVAQGTKQPARSKPSVASAKTKPKPADRKLTLDQIRKLLGAGVPDGVLAQEIEARGITGDFTRADVDRLRQAGLTATSLTAVMRLLPTGGLTVRTVAGARVQIRGGPLLTADANGMASFTNLEPRTYEVAASLEHHSDASRSIAVAARQTNTLDLPLEWSVGFLSVRTNVPDAVVSGPGILPSRGGVTHRAMPVGDVTITATAPYRQARSEMVRIEPGVERTLTITLSVDEAALHATEREITNRFRQKRYADVTALSASYLAAGGSDGTVLGYIASSHFERGQYDAFRQQVGGVLSSGGAITLAVYHHHLVAGGFGGSTIHPAELTFSRDGLLIQSSSKCNVPDVRTPFNRVRTGSKSRAMFAKEPSADVLNLEIPDPGNPKKQITINLLAGSSLLDGSPAQALVTFRPDTDKLQAIRDALAMVLR